MTLKDGHDVAGVRTTIGTPDLDWIAEHDGTVAARLRAAGAIILGHTNVAPYLADYQSANEIFGRTANPWDTERTAGGSSGGAAAALAAGLTPLEVVSDLAGSARLPAHFCGVYGLNTEHRVPLTGFFRVPGDAPRIVRILSCLGPMARDLDDLELALRLIAGPDGHDSDVPPVPLEPRRLRDVGALRLAVAPTLPGATVASDARGQVERVAGAASEAGARVDQRLPGVEWEALYELFGELITATTGALDPSAAPRSLLSYLESLHRRDGCIAAWETFFADVDALVAPAGTTAAFRHCDPRQPADVDGRLVSYSDQGRPLVPFNLSGHPALAAPAGLGPGDLPIGIQLVGPLWSETRLLDIASALEEAGILPGFQRPPGW
jgi:amidase